MGIQWASAAELASLVQRSEVDTITSNLLLSAAADIIRNEVGQDIDLLTTSETYDGPRGGRHHGGGSFGVDGYGSVGRGRYGGDPTLMLMQRPCISVTSVTEDQVGVGVVTLTQGADYVLGAGGKLHRINNGNEDYAYPWTTKYQGIVVEYTHGWDVSTPQYQTAKQLSMQIAARGYLNPEGLYELKVGGYEESRFSRATPVTGLLQLTPIEKIMLNSLRSNWLTW